MDALQTLPPLLTTSHKYHLLQQAMKREQSVSALFVCVFGDTWSQSSLYDFLLGDEGLVAPVLKHLCRTLHATELTAMLGELCRNSDKPQAREVWEVFTLEHCFPCAFITPDLISLVAETWRTRVQIYRTENRLRDQVLEVCFDLLLTPISVGQLSAVALLPPNKRPKEVAGLSMKWGREAVKGYLEQNTGEVTAVCAALEMLGAGETWEPLTECLLRLPTSPYIPPALATRALTLVNLLLQGELSVQCLNFSVPIVQYILLETQKNPINNPLYLNLTALFGQTNTEGKDYLKRGVLQAEQHQVAIVIAQYWCGSQSHWRDEDIKHRIEAALDSEITGEYRALAVQLLLKAGVRLPPIPPIPTLDAQTMLRLWLQQLQQGSDPVHFPSLLQVILPSATSCLPLYYEVCAWLGSPSLFTPSLKAHIVAVTYGLIQVCDASPQLLAPLAEVILTISTWAEEEPNALGLPPLLDFAVTSSELHRLMQLDKLRHRNFVRLKMLFFIAEKAGNAAYVEGMSRVMDLVLDALESEEIHKCNSPYTAHYKRKLYLCQLLIASEPGFPLISQSLLSRILSVLIHSLEISMIFDLNIYFHRTIACVVLQASSFLLPTLLACLSNPDLRPQAGCCFILSAGKVLISLENSSMRDEIYHKIVPFSISNNAQLRRSAQFVLYEGSSLGLLHPAADISSLITAINTSKDCVKMRKRLEKSIARFDLKNGFEEVMTGEDNIFDETYAGLVLRSLAGKYREIMKQGQAAVMEELRKREVVVVASFLEKNANIAGLVKTCLSFQVQLLTIPNRLILAETEFRAATEGCEQLQPIVEVLPRDVEHFLAYYKAQGYALVGLEQTATSVPLHTFSFPSKTVVLLGVEKEGIPPEIIPMLDVCVEIPQFGLIRSLNVHVSAAICLTAYLETASH